MKLLTATLLCTAVTAALFSAPASALEFEKAKPKPQVSTALSAIGALRAMAAGGADEVALPRCVRSEGSMRIVEPDDGQALWASYGLPMPTRMLRVFVAESNCWTVLDRGAGFAAAQAERELAAGGHLQGSSNLGGGQMLAADYILIPDIVSQNTNAGGSRVGAGASGSSGLLGMAKIGFGRQTKKQTAGVMLTLVDSRTSEILGSVSGEAEFTDKQWQIMMSGAAQTPAGGGSGNLSAGAYENTEIGTVIRSAYRKAYDELLKSVASIDFRARVNSAPKASQQTQVAQTTAYGTGGSETATTSSMPAQMMLDQQAAYAAQQLQLMQQMRQPQAGNGMSLEVANLVPAAGQAGGIAQTLTQVAGAALTGQQQGGNIGQTLAQVAGAALGGQQPDGNLGQTLAQVAGAALTGQQQGGNIGQTLAQVAGAALGGQQQDGNLGQTLAQVAGAALTGQQQGGNIGQTLAQVAGAALTGPQQGGNIGQTLAQVAGAALTGHQQGGNIGQTLAQVAGAALTGQQQGGNIGQTLAQVAGAALTGQQQGGNIGQTLAQVAGAALTGQQQGGNIGQTLAQVAGAALTGQQQGGNIGQTLAQVAGAALTGQQQGGNIGQTLAQVAGAALTGQQQGGNIGQTLAQVAGAALTGQQQGGNIGQTLAQVAGAALNGQQQNSTTQGLIQTASAALAGQQQGNLVQGLTQIASQQLAAQVGNTGAIQGTGMVLVLRGPANFMRDATGAGGVLRVLQPGEAFVHVATSAQGHMLQVRDLQGSVGWIESATQADIYKNQ